MTLSRCIGGAVLLSVVSWASPLRAAETGWARANLVFRTGASVIDPRSSSLELASGDRLIVDDESTLTLEAAVMLSPRWGFELFLAPDPEHRFFTEGSAGRVRFGGTEQFLEMVTMQYHFDAVGRLRPYVGAGVAYAEYDAITPLGLDIDRSFGAGLQAGLDIEIAPRLLFNLGVRWADVDPELTLNGVSIGSARVDPMIYSASFGWRVGR